MRKVVAIIIMLLCTTGFRTHSYKPSSIFEGEITMRVSTSESMPLSKSKEAGEYVVSCVNEIHAEVGGELPPPPPHLQAKHDAEIYSTCRQEAYALYGKYSFYIQTTDNFGHETQTCFTNKPEIINRCLRLGS